MSNKDLQKQIDDLTKLVEELKLKINIKDLLKPINIYEPMPLPAICQHKYPFPWHAIFPPSCEKCGKQAEEAYKITW